MDWAFAPRLGFDDVHGQLEEFLACGDLGWEVLADLAFDVVRVVCSLTVPRVRATPEARRRSGPVVRGRVAGLGFVQQLLLA